MTWLVSNLGTIVVLLLVAAVVFFAVRAMVRQKKRGCSCGCESCSAASCPKCQKDARPKS